ncbi:hypothetical protein D3C84_871840 [compost metagenome]
MLNLKTYALLINRWMMDLQSGMYQINNTKDYVTKHIEYTENMDKLYKRLQREYNFTKEKFYQLQDQAVMF